MSLKYLCIEFGMRLIEDGMACAIFPSRQEFGMRLIEDGMDCAESWHFKV